MSETSEGKKVFNWGQFLVVGLMALVVGGLFVYVFLPRSSVGLSQAEVNSAIANATANRDKAIADLQAQLAAKGNVTVTGTGSGTVTVIKETGGYLIDTLALSTPLLDKTLSDREISLFDGKVDFNGDSYDTDETFFIDGLELKANENDFEGNVYLTVPEGSLSYKMTFETSLDTLAIGTDDETLTFDFLGKEVEVLNWDTSSVTFVSGESYLLTEGQSITVEGKNVTLNYVTEDYAYVSVSGVGSKVLEGQTKSINGLEVRASSILYSSKAESKAELRIAKEVETSVDDGDEYEENSPWVWTIDGSSIGLKLNEGYTDLDEEFSALAPKDEVCLPNRYVCIKYNGLSDVDREKYTFDMDGSYVLIKGDLISGIKDFSRVYVSNTGLVYEKDGSIYTEITEDIRLGNTDSLLTVVDGNIVIEDLEISLALNEVTANGIVISFKNVDYRTNYGILIDNPEDSIDNNELSITVPDEKVSGSITIKDVNFKEVTNTTTNSTA